MHAASKVHEFKIHVKVGARMTSVGRTGYESAESSQKQSKFSRLRIGAEHDEQSADSEKR